MNKERKATVTILISVLKANSVLSSRMSRAVEKGIEASLGSEERALRAMEPYKETPNTAANYRNTVSSITHLKRALEAVVDSEVELAADQLDAAMDPTARQVHTKPKRVRR